MTFRFTESRDSRDTGGNPAYHIKRFTAAGSNDESYVRSYALQVTPNAVATAHGILWRKDLRVKPKGYELFKVSVHYSSIKAISGEYSLSFDTTGGTVHITNSKQTVSIYDSTGKVTTPDHKGAIGVEGDNVKGSDIVIPALKLTVEFRHPAGIISIAKIKDLARNTGKVSSDTFLTFAPGEVLFLGAQGSEGTDVETSVRYNFACSENVSDLSFGDAITGVEKKGWEYAWVSYTPDTSGGKPVRKPAYVYVEKIYETVSLSTLLGFGG